MLRIISFVITSVIAAAIIAQAETVGDVDGNDLVGLEESIYALQVVAGLKPTNVEQTNITVESVFNPSLEGLGNIIGWAKDRIAILSKSRVIFDINYTTVPLNQILTKTSDGTIHATYGSAWYHNSNMPAAELFGAIPFGPEVIEYLAWIYQGNGLTLWQKLYDDKGYNIKVMPCGAGTAESGGWFKNPINTISDFNGLKMRSCGLASLMLQKVGAITQCYSGGQILSKFLDGSIDAAEFSTPAVDANAIDFKSVANYNYFPGWHQPAIILELIINKDIWNGLTLHQQMAIDMTCRAATLENITYSDSIQSQYIINNTLNGVQNRYFTDDILATLKTKADEVMAEQSLADSDFGAIWSDYTQFHQKYSTWLDLGFNPRR